MRIVRFIGFVLIILFVSMGCGKDSNVNTHIEEGASGGSIIVHVSDGDPISRPIYTWSDGADITAAILKVEQVSPLVTVWEVRSTNPSLDNIQSPVIHGTVPLNANPISHGSDEQLDLQTDVSYRVTVTKADIGQTGSREFLIKP